MTVGLSFDNLEVGYGKHSVARDISMHVAAGTLVCLLGKNGSGKSTLLKTIAGFLAPLHGSVMFGDVPLQTLSAKELAKTVSIVLTKQMEARNLTVTETVAMGRSPFSGFFGTTSAADDAIVADAMQKVGVDILADRIISTLSDGEYQKVMIAKSLAQQTPVVLLDEPTAFLDFSSKVDVLETVKTLTHEEGKISIVTTHDVNLAMKIADELWLMQNNTIKQCANDSEIYGFIGEKAQKYL